MFGEILGYILSFMVSVLAGIVSYYICKRLDRIKNGSKPAK